MRKFCCCKKVFCNTILTKSVYCDIIFCAPDNSGAENKIFIGVWLSVVECLVRDQEAGGSNPLTPTSKMKAKKCRKCRCYLHFSSFSFLFCQWSFAQKCAFSVVKLLSKILSFKNYLKNFYSTSWLGVDSKVYNVIENALNRLNYKITQYEAAVETGKLIWNGNESNK